MKPKEVKALTLRDYDRMFLAQLEKESEEWNKVRVIETALFNFGGMGAKKMVEPKQVRSIPLIDNKDITLPIRTPRQAIKLLDNFVKWQG